MRVWIDGVGILGPGLEAWPQARAILTGEAEYRETRPPDPPASMLPPNERRRSSDLVRWAIEVGREAIVQAQADPQELATVFASSGGEMSILDQLCTALATPERVISPTLFHQSVHNAAAGYWGIATSSRQSSTALSCYDASFGGGLLDAAAYACTEEKSVLLVAYDLPSPGPLYAARPIRQGFAVAIVLTPHGSQRSFVELDLTLRVRLSDTDTCMDESALEALRCGNPAARSLPLLAAIAKGQPADVSLEYFEDQSIVIGVVPCRS
ncbi:MAG: beta-ketoacyl synthase chain length factor [Nitrospiraceae bacterium]